MSPRRRRIREVSVFAGWAAMAFATACTRAPKPDAYGNIEANEVVVSAQTGAGAGD